MQHARGRVRGQRSAGAPTLGSFLKFRSTTPNRAAAPSSAWTRSPDHRRTRDL